MIIIAPTNSKGLAYSEVPTIMNPLIEATVIETLSLCINLTIKTIVKRTETPVTIIKSHCHRFGTIKCEAGKNTGIAIELTNTN